MLRFKQVINATNKHNAVAGADTKRGAFVDIKQYGTDYVIVPANGLGEYIVDVPRTTTCTGAEAPYADNEVIKSGNRCIAIPTHFGEAYASSEVANGLAAGDGLVAKDGTLIKAKQGEEFTWVYCTEDNDPTGIKLHKIERVTKSEQA